MTADHYGSMRLAKQLPAPTRTYPATQPCRPPRRIPRALTLVRLTSLPSVTARKSHYARRIGSLLGRCRDDAKLLHYPGCIQDNPALSYLPVCEPVDGPCGDGDLLPCWGYAEKRTLVSPLPGGPAPDSILVGDLFLKCPPRIRERRNPAGQPLPECLTAWTHPWWRIVLDVVSMEDLVLNGQGVTIPRWLRDEEANGSVARPQQCRAVPHACRNGKTAVMSSHSKASETAFERGISRSALAVKCPPNSRSTFEAAPGARQVYTSNLGKRHLRWATATEIRGG